MNERSSDPRVPRDSSWYRREAERFRQRAATITDDNQLRDSYLSLARCYERLAAALEGSWSSWGRLMNRLNAPAAPGNPIEEPKKRGSRGLFMNQRNSGLLERAAFYRAQASEGRAFAAGELNSALRDTLLDIARQYEELAA